MPAQNFETYEWISVKRDPSTGLGTLVALFESLERYIKMTWSAGTTLSLLHIDIDRLGDLNRSLGHSLVDELIAHFALSVRELLEAASLNCRIDDTFYRIGGDEFAVLLPGVDVEQALSIAEEIRNRFVHDPLAHAAHHPTLSIGVATVPHNAHDLGSLITAADMGVLEAKGKGGNAVYISEKEPIEGYELVVAARIINMLARRMVETGTLLVEAQHVAFTDPVSGLPNQRAMHRFLEREHQRAVRYHRPFSILLVDGDSLKEFNDQLGHEAGNAWIHQLSRILVEQTRATDLVARWFTGDEFIVVLTETDRAEAMATAERIREAVAQAGRQMPIHGTVSIGVATFPHDGYSIKELLDRADYANGEAKRRGRDQVFAYQVEAAPADTAALETASTDGIGTG